MWFKNHYQISIMVEFFLMISFFLLSLTSFPLPPDWISVSGCNVCLEDKQPQAEQVPVSSAAHGVHAPSSTAVAAIAPDEGWTLELDCSPHPDERQLWTDFGLFCLQIYPGLPREQECKEKSQIKPEPCRPLRPTLFGPYVLQVHFIGIVNWSGIRARF